MRLRFIILLVLFLALPAAAQDVVANQVLQLTNQARSAVGVPPLTMNALLVQAAQRHSNDMAANDNLTHVGTDNSQFWERIQDTGYTLSTGGENVLYRWDTDPNAVYQQWYDSQGHRDNMLNPDFLEVGIAYSRSQSGAYYFTMVLATQPGMTAPPVQPTTPPSATPLPTLTPVPTQLPPSTQAPPPTFTPLPPPTFTLIPTDPVLATIIAPVPTNTFVPTVAWQIATNTPFPTATQYLPPDIRLIYDERSFALVNVSGRALNLSNLIFESASGSLSASRWNTDYLSQPLTSFTDDDCLQVWGFTYDYLEKPTDCRFRHAWIVVSDANLFWQGVDTFTVRNGTDRIAVCSFAIGICDVSFSARVTDVPVDTTTSAPLTADLRLVYNYNSFALVNVSGRILDLRGITFNADSRSLAIERWDNGYLTQPLTSFTSGDCLQAWGLGENTVYPPPESCRVRHSWIASADDFWRNTDFFTVERDGVRLASCEVARGICEVSLSANFGQSETSNPVAAPTALVSSGADIRLILWADGFTLLNTSGRTLDLTGLAFESDGGVFVASRWNIPELTRPLNTFPAGDCLQTWRSGGEYQAPPADCDTRHAWVAVGADAQFWLNANTFRVRRGADFITTCETRVATCEFNLP